MSNRRTLGDDFAHETLTGATRKELKKENPSMKLLYTGKETEAIVAAKTHEPAFTGAQKLANEIGLEYYGFIDRADAEKGVSSTMAWVPIWLNALARLFYNFQIKRAFVLEKARELAKDIRKAAVVETLNSTDAYHSIADFLGYYTWVEPPPRGPEEPEPTTRKRAKKKGSAHQKETHARTDKT